MTHPRSARAALLLSLLVLLAPTSGMAGDEPVERADSDAARVVLVPLNLGVTALDEVEPGLEPVWQAMLEHFDDGEHRVTAIEPGSARALWSQVMAALKAVEGDDPHLFDAYERFARRVAEQVDYAQIVFPALVARAAQVNGETARWDGVRERVHGAEHRDKWIDSSAGAFVVRQDGVRGQLAAASLHVAVMSPEGQLRFEGTGGLALLQEIGREGRNRSLVAKLRPDAFDDADALRRGIEVALRRPVPASAAALAD